MTARIVLLAILVLSLVAPGCGMDDSESGVTDFETRDNELRVPGPWAPPANTRAIAATQYVPVVDPPAVSPLGSCSSTNAFACSCRHPSCSPAYGGTVELDQYLRRRFNYLTSGGLYCCRQNSARTSVPKLSVHAVGRAIDLMVPLEAGDANNGLGDPVANWLVENAEFIGVQRVIWDKGYWNGERGFGLLSPNSLSHTNHIHVELSAAGAAKQTAFFTSGASAGNCMARCDGTRIINADCSSGDCGFYGATCIPGNPPVCGPPPPPEPPEAEAVPNAPLPTMGANAAPGRFNFVTPRRVFDTRSGSGGVTRGDGSTTGPLTATGVNVATLSNLPAGASAAWLNVAAILPAERGFMTVHPADTATPNTSSLNFVPGFVRSNAVPVALGNGNRVAIKASSDLNAIADLFGTFAPTGDGLTATPPTRVLDTRSAGIPIPAGGSIEVDVQAPAGSTGVMATVAAIGGNDAGFLTAYPCGTPVPDTSNLNYAANSVTANAIVSALDGNGRLCLRSQSEVHVILDVAGYLSPDGPLSYQPLTPTRLLDTRSPTSLYKNRLGNRQIIQLPIQSLQGMPDGVWSVAVNIAVLNATEAGFVTAFPCGGSVPTASSLNFPPNDPVAGLSVTRVGMNGNLCIFASTRAHMIVDVQGVWKHIDALQPPQAPVVEDPDDQGDEVDPGDPQLIDLPGGFTNNGNDEVPGANNSDGNGETPGQNDSEDGEFIQTSEGCATVRTAATPTSGLFLLLMGFWWRRRRQQA